jgi:hypothetical protein
MQDDTRKMYSKLKDREPERENLQDGAPASSIHRDVRPFGRLVLLSAQTARLPPLSLASCVAIVWAARISHCSDWMVARRLSKKMGPLNAEVSTDYRRGI